MPAERFPFSERFQTYEVFPRQPKLASPRATVTVPEAHTGPPR